VLSAETVRQLYDGQSLVRYGTVVFNVPLDTL